MEQQGPWFGVMGAGVAAEAAELNLALEAAGAGSPPATAEAIVASRLPPDGSAAASLPFEDHEVGGGVRLRLFTPSSPRGACLSIHGGGWMTGGYDQEDAGLSAFAEGSRLVVASVDYRLAPECPYPAAADDCERAARWFVEHCHGRLALERLLISGGSAGAHLAVTTLLRVRGEKLSASPFSGAILAAGVYDLSMTPSQRLWKRDLVLSVPMMEVMYESYTPGRSPEERRDPDISPLYADLRGMPPAIFTVGSADPFLDDSVFLASRWRLAGNDAELHVLPEGIHGFAGFPLEITDEYNRANGAFIERVLA